ncbi:uncharacterized protein J3R85_007624 [Psidium guajava]|nr:uncharacterized protein J3R85_007624 [Psidium guajava]
MNTHQNSKDEPLAGFLKPLDVCGKVKDIFSQLKECIQELESSSREGGRDHEQASEVEHKSNLGKDSRKWSQKLLDHGRWKDRSTSELAILKSGKDANTPNLQCIQETGGVGIEHSGN